MTYSIDGTPLDNEAMGWRLMRTGTTALGGIVRERTEIKVPGYDGYFRAPATVKARTLVFRVTTPLASLEPLLALVDTPRGLLCRTDDPTRVADFEMVSAIPSSTSQGDEFVSVTVTLSIPGAAWRDAEPSVFGPVTIANASQTLDLPIPLSAPVRDADVFLGGEFDEFQLVDSAGSWLRSTGPITTTSTSGVLYIGATGQAFLANKSAPWTPLADVSNLIDVSGGGGFKITLRLEPGDPSDRRGRLTLTTTEQTDTDFRVRIRGAYTIQ